MLQGVGPYVALGRDTTLLRGILEKTANRLGHDLKDQPEVEAEIRTSIGSVYKQLAEYEKAETMYRAALLLRQSSLGPDEPATVSSLLNIADCMVSRGDITGAEAMLHEALARQNKSIAGRKETDAEAHDARLDASRRSQFLAEVQVIQRRLLERLRRLKGDNDPVVTQTLENIGGIAAEQGELDTAESSMREALAQQRREFGPEHRDIALTLMNLGAIAFSQGQYEEAEKTWREALAIQRKLLDPEHPDIAQMLMNLTAVAIVRRDFPAAEATGREALAMLRRLYPRDHPNIAWALNNLGEVSMVRGNPGDAEPLFREALAMSRRLFSDQSPLIGTTLNNLAEAL